MRRLPLEKIVVGVVGLILVGVVTLIVVTVASYDGRTSAERREDEGLAGPSWLNYCPEGEPSRKDLPTGNHAQPHAVVPGGPADLRVCEYRGHSLWSEDSERTGRLVAEEVAHELQTAPPKGADLICPPEGPARILAIFYYPHAPEVTIVARAEGCRTAGARGRPAVLASKGTIDRLRRHEGDHAEESEVPPE